MYYQNVNYKLIFSHALHDDGFSQVFLATCFEGGKKTERAKLPLLEGLKVLGEMFL